MSTTVQVYEKVRYAGYAFCTSRSQKLSKTDNSNVAKPYNVVLANGKTVRQILYGKIECLFIHHLYPLGPSRCVLKVNWFVDHGFAPSGCPLVDTTKDWETSYVFLEDCFQIPVAVWPHDPLGRKVGETAQWSEIIDRNQDEVC